MHWTARTVKAIHLRHWTARTFKALDCTGDSGRTLHSWAASLSTSCLGHTKVVWRSVQGCAISRQVVSKDFSSFDGLVTALGERFAAG